MLNLKTLILIGGVALIMFGIFGHTTIERGIYGTQSWEDDQGNELGYDPSASNSVAAIITGILVGVGVIMILFATVFEINMAVIIGFVAGTITTVYFYYLTPY